MQRIKDSYPKKQRDAYISLKFAEITYRALLFKIITYSQLFFLHSVAKM